MLASKKESRKQPSLGIAPGNLSRRKAKSMPSPGYGLPIDVPLVEGDVDARLGQKAIPLIGHPAQWIGEKPSVP